MEKHCLCDRELADRLGISVAKFKKKKYKEDGYDFTMAECHIVKEMFNARGENLLIPEIFFDELEERT